LLDLSCDPPAAPGVDGAWQPEPAPSDLFLVAEAGRDLLGRLASAAAFMGRALSRDPTAPDGAGPVGLPTLSHAPRTGFNVTITPERSFATADVSLDSVKTIGRAARGTVNDVALALCAGAVRRYLSGKLPDVPLVALVPVSVRTDTSALGNQVSAMLISLPTHLADPAERLGVIVEATQEAKGQDHVVDVATIAEWADLVAPGLAAKAARAMLSEAVVERFGPVFNVVVSNVRGPDFPMYLAGAKLVRLWPMGPVADGAALNLTAMSYLGRLRFGLVACRRAVPDLAELAESIESELAVLLALAAGRPDGASAKNGASFRGLLK
jgi:diacylglycerol O-acyltransferase